MEILSTLLTPSEKNTSYQWISLQKGQDFDNLLLVFNNVFC